MPWKSGTLEPKIKEFIYIAIDTSTTHLHRQGARQHIRNALEHGATKEEIMEVFQCVSVLGIHAATEGVPMLVEEAGTRKDRGRQSVIAVGCLRNTRFPVLRLSVK